MPLIVKAIPKIADPFEPDVTDDIDSHWKKELANATTHPADLLKKLELEHYQKHADAHPGFKCLVTDPFAFRGF